jgi:hypothetical protein
VAFEVDDSIIPNGVQGTGAIGTVGFLINSTIVLVGVSGSGAVSAATPTPTAKPTGVSGTGAIGTVAIEIDDSKLVTGVAGTGAVGTVLIRGWTIINDAQAANWEQINTAA